MIKLYHLIVLFVIMATQVQAQDKASINLSAGVTADTDLIVQVGADYQIVKSKFSQNLSRVKAELDLYYMPSSFTITDNLESENLDLNYFMATAGVGVLITDEMQSLATIYLSAGGAGALEQLPEENNLGLEFTQETGLKYGYYGSIEVSKWIGNVLPFIEYKYLNINSTIKPNHHLFTGGVRIIF